MKKTYCKPSVKTVNLRCKCSVLQASPLIYDVSPGYIVIDEEGEAE